MTVDYQWFERAAYKSAEGRNEEHLTLLQLCFAACAHDAENPPESKGQGAVGITANVYGHSAAWVRKNARLWETWQENEDLLTPDLPPHLLNTCAKMPDPRHALRLATEVAYRQQHGVDSDKDRLSVRELKRIVYGETEPEKAGATFRWRGAVEEWDVEGQRVTLTDAAISGDKPQGKVEAVVKELVE